MRRDLDVAGELAAIEAELEPAGEQEAAKAIDLVAETLQVATPSAAGLAVYVRMLGKLPCSVLWKATERVLETHTFKTLPTPGEWIQAGKDLQGALTRQWSRLRTYDGRRQVAALYYPEDPRPALTQEERPANMQKSRKLTRF